MDRALGQKLLYLVNDKTSMDAIRAYVEWRYEQQHKKIRTSRGEHDLGVLVGMVQEMDLLLNIRETAQGAANAN